LLKSINDRDPRAVRERTRAFFQDPGAGSLIERAMVEAEFPGLADPRALPQPSRSQIEDPQIEIDEPQRIAILVDRRLPCYLVLADYHAPGWTAHLEDLATGQTTSAPIYRTNRVLRGVFVPAGEHRVTFRYRPLVLYVGAAISAVAWISLAVCAFRRRSRA
jgi:hypothetical protein